MKSQTKNNKTTTYYLIRHAEKDRTDLSNKNPDLTTKGKKRAEYWASVFKNVPFDAIYSTNYNRTLQTAMPLSKNLNLKIQLYNPQKIYSEEFKLKTEGKTILIVGHSDTTPKFVNKIIGSQKYEEIEDSNNSNLYIVTIINNKISANLLNIGYKKSH